MIMNDDEMMQNKIIKEEIKDEIKEEIEEEEVQDSEYFNEDEFILGNSSDAGQAKLSISEMPPYKRRSKIKKKKKLKKSNSNKKKKSKSSKKKLKSGKKKRKTKKKLTKKENVNTNKLTLDIDNKKAKIPIGLDQKMRSMALLVYSDEPSTSNETKNKLNIKLQNEKPKTSLSLLDEILKNQVKMFRKNSKDSDEIFPNNEISDPKLKKMTTPTTNNVADINLESIQQQKKDAPPPDTGPGPPLVHYSTVPIPRSHLNIPPQQQILPPHSNQQPFLMAPPDPNLALIQQGMNLLKNTFPIGLFNNIGGGIPPISQSHQPPNNLGGIPIGMNSQQPTPDALMQQIPPHLINILAGQNKQPPSMPPFDLNESFNVHQQQHFLAIKPPLPVPPPPLPPPNTSAIDPLIPPPPPPPHQIQSSSRCGLDSPMDIECDEGTTAADGSKNGSNDQNQQQKTKKKRSRPVQIADELMKNALKPYFARRKITKDEYKDIMKRGVAKLSKCQSLRPEKVEKFVEKYVDSVRKERRGNRQFH